MSSNSIIFHTSRGISSSPAAFLFLIFLSIESNSSCVNCSSLMPICLIIILAIHSWVTFGGFPSNFSKCFFHSCIRSSLLVAFNLAFAVLFFPLLSLTVWHAILDCLSSTESLILLIWFCMYSICSFRYMLANSFCVSFSFRALILFVFLLLHFEAVFTSARFVLSTNVTHGTLSLTLCLVGMHSAAASRRALTKFLYSSFGVCVSDFCSASNFFLSVNVYLSLISLLLCSDQSLYTVVILASFLPRFTHIFAVTLR